MTEENLEKFLTATSSRQIRDFKDATKNLWLTIKPRHALHCKRRDSMNCVQNRAILSMPGVKASKVFQTITYIWYEGDDVPTRYQNSSDARYFAMLNDKGGRRAIIEYVKDETVRGVVRVELLVPNESHSKAYLRSPLAKERRLVARQRRKHKDAARKYTKPHTEGMRSGTGQAHVWKT
jgi:hypothetical protein